MSDNTRREAASTDPPHPARHPHPPLYSTAPRAGTWPDARTAEVLLSGATSWAPPTVPADRLVRLLAAARDGHAPLDPAREAAALAAFRSAAAGRARGAVPARAHRRPLVVLRTALALGAAGAAGSRGRPLAALRTAFAVRRPRVMAAAVVSALALGGVAVGMAAVARSFTPGEGAGTGPLDTRPPAAVSPDGSTAGPFTAGPGPLGGSSRPPLSPPLSPPAQGGAEAHRHGKGHQGHGHGYGSGRGTGHGHSSDKDQESGHLAPSAGRTGGGRTAETGTAEKAEKGHSAGGSRHSGHGRRPALRAPRR
ncbi:hypothetical protein [Actinacidiphila paucisporea]|uniref:Uncharacterized protein n=1 Tax=Actinacidiphila paucisporea TaxID=310782 RepID=A0A1M6U866_9ACTN|nr:hypothetical protein [Actinacidiphila paucisporea]SHK65379.1 hypothetical protein SAMN05216499_101277 [Actinacidiphila paucisporea]